MKLPQEHFNLVLRRIIGKTSPTKAGTKEPAAVARLQVKPATKAAAAKPKATPAAKTMGAGKRAKPPATAKPPKPVAAKKAVKKTR